MEAFSKLRNLVAATDQVVDTRASDQNHQCVKTPDLIASRISKLRLPNNSASQREGAADSFRAEVSPHQMKRKIEIDKKFFRTVQFDRAAVNDTARTLTLSISSDTPYLRQDFFGQPYYEILDHSGNGILAGRLQAGTALLWNHNTNQQLGRNISFENDGHKITVTAKFSRSPFAEEKWQDVQDGILVDSSVGYVVIDVEDLDQQIDGIPVYRMTWEPLEASLVTVPADITVGVGRNTETTLVRQHHMETTLENKQKENGRTATQEKERINEIRFVANRPTFKRFVTDAEVQKAIDEDWSSRRFKDFVMEKLGDGTRPILTPSGRDLREMFSGDAIESQIVENPEFRRLREGGRKLISFEIPGIRSFREMQRATTLTSDVGTTVMQVPGVQGSAFEQLVVADLLAQGTTTSGKVTYPQEQSFTGTATTVAEAGAKPEQDFDIAPASATAKKIAAWTKISDELLEDSPAAEAYIRSRLGFAVQKQEDNQILNGDGTGSNMTGILHTVGLQSQAKGSDTTLDAIRKAIGKVEENSDFICEGIVINVHDWTNIEMLKDTNNRYLVGQLLTPDEFGRPRLAPSLWGKPVAVSKSLAQGTVLVGAFKSAAQLFRRKGLIIEATNSNEDDFKHNLILIRAELRAALAVYAGGAFCQVTGLSA